MMTVKAEFFTLLLAAMLWGCGGGGNTTAPPPVTTSTSTTTTQTTTSGNGESSSNCVCGYIESASTTPENYNGIPFSSSQYASNNLSTGSSVQCQVTATLTCYSQSSQNPCYKSNETKNITTAGTWSDSNTNVASVEQGLVVGKGTGSAEITFSYLNIHGDTQKVMWVFNVSSVSGAPTVSLIPNKTSGKVPLEVIFSIICDDADGSCVNYSINFGDGTSNQTGAISDGVAKNLTYTYSSTGTYTVTVTVKDNSDKTATAQKTIQALP